MNINEAFCLAGDRTSDTMNCKVISCTLRTSLALAVHTGPTCEVDGVVHWGFAGNVETVEQGTVQVRPHPLGPAA